MNKKLLILIGIAIVVGTVAALLKGSSFGAQALWSLSEQGRWLLPLILASAVLDSINPCAFSVLLLTIAFLLSVGSLRKHIMRVGGAYIFGIFAAYLLIGLGILQVLHLFNTPHVIGSIGAVLLVVLGLVNIIGKFMPSFPIKLRIPQAVHRPMATLMQQASLPAAFALGALVGLCEFPCTGGPYMTALGLLHDQATYLKGFGYLLLYNVVFVAPLIVVLAIAGDRFVLDKLNGWRASNIRNMRLWSGIAMVVLGVLIYLL